jgi:putative glutamine amidotransferase
MASPRESNSLQEFPALVVPGGTVVDPARYGAPRSPRTQEADPHRDAVEIAICQAAVEANRPLLAICRGSQVLNVALGGTLVQHIDHHMRRDLYNGDVHEVTVEPDSVLGSIAGTRLHTNSLHHQAIDVVARGARAVAHAADGTVEAIEVTGAPRVLGVQWHPELLRHRAEHLALFRWLVGN